MKRYPPYCDVDSQSGHILAVLEDRTVECEVPRIFGEVLFAEVRGDYIVAHTARGTAQIADPRQFSMNPRHDHARGRRARIVIVIGN